MLAVILADNTNIVITYGLVSDSTLSVSRRETSGMDGMGLGPG